MTISSISTYEALRTEYKWLRTAMKPLHHAIIKRIPETALTEAARGLGMLDDDRRFIFRCPEERTILFDHALYAVPHEGKTTIERYAEAREPKATGAEARLLCAMLRSRYTIVRIEKCHAGLGCEISDALYGGNRFLMDAGFGSTSRSGLHQAGRVLDMGEYIITSGASLPCPEGLPMDTRRKFPGIFDGATPAAETPSAERLEIERFVLNATLITGSSASVRYV